MRHKRRELQEINLTSLLDVLFCILFIVMLGSAQNEENIKLDASQQVEELQQQIENLQQQILVQEEQLVFYGNQMESHKLYASEAVVVTLRNIRKDETHVLRASSGMEEAAEESVTLGINRKNIVKLRIQSFIDGILSQTENQPVYIVFHCDKNCIYTEEYKGIIESLEELQASYKEVFYKVMEVQK